MITTCLASTRSFLTKPAVIILPLIIGICPLVSVYANSEISNEGDSSRIEPTSEQQAEGVGRSKEDMEKHKIEHPTFPVLKEVPFMPTVDPEKYKTEKNSATQRMQKHLDKQRWNKSPQKIQQ